MNELYRKNYSGKLKGAIFGCAGTTIDFAMVKIGDTLPDLEEKTNTGMWSAGVVDSSNEMSLTINEINMLDKAKLEKRRKKVRDEYLKAGADYVIDNLAELKELINIINARLACGEKP